MGKNIKMHYSLQSEGRKSSVLLLWGGQRLPQHHRTPRSHVERDEARWGTKKHTRANSTNNVIQSLISRTANQKTCSLALLEMMALQFSGPLQKKEHEYFPMRLQIPKGKKKSHLWVSLIKWTSLLTSPLGAAVSKASTFITKSLALRGKKSVCHFL